MRPHGNRRKSFGRKADGVFGRDRASNSLVRHSSQQSRKHHKPLRSKSLWMPLTGQRRGRDSNPRYPFGHTGFRNQHDKPLCHLSGYTSVLCGAAVGFGLRYERGLYGRLGDSSRDSCAIVEICASSDAGYGAIRAENPWKAEHFALQA